MMTSCCLDSTHVLTSLQEHKNISAAALACSGLSFGMSEVDPTSQHSVDQPFNKTHSHHNATCCTDGKPTPLSQSALLSLINAGCLSDLHRADSASEHECLQQLPSSRSSSFSAQRTLPVLAGMPSGIEEQQQRQQQQLQSCLSVDQLQHVDSASEHELSVLTPHSNASFSGANRRTWRTPRSSDCSEGAIAADGPEHEACYSAASQLAVGPGLSASADNNICTESAAWQELTKPLGVLQQPTSSSKLPSCSNPVSSRFAAAGLSVDVSGEVPKQKPSTVTAVRSSSGGTAGPECSRCIVRSSSQSPTSPLSVGLTPPSPINLVPLSPGCSKQKKLPARRPSRIILSAIAPDGSVEAEPKLYVSIPKSPVTERQRHAKQRQAGPLPLLSPHRRQLISPTLGMSPLLDITTMSPCPTKAHVPVLNMPALDGLESMYMTSWSHDVLGSNLAVAATKLLDGSSPIVTHMETVGENDSIHGDLERARSLVDSDMDDAESEEWWCGSPTGMLVSQIMGAPALSVSQEADVAAARALMAQHDVSALLVDTGGSEPGFVTRRDFLKMSFKRRLPKRKLRVKDIMSCPVIWIAADAPIEACAQMLQERSIRRAAVRDVTKHDPTNPLAEYIGVVSDVAIFRSLGLYPAEPSTEEQEEGLRHAATGMHSNTDTPASSRSCTPIDPPTPNSLPVETAQQLNLQPDCSNDSGSTSACGASQPAQALATLCVIVAQREQREACASSGSLMSDSSAASHQAAATGSQAVVNRHAAACDSLTHAATEPPAVVNGHIAAADGLNHAVSDPPAALERYMTAAALWELDFQEIEMLRKIGEGSFGEVMLGSFRGTKVRTGQAAATCDMPLSD